MLALSPLLAACGGFLLAVLWMDLMFDVQVLHHRRDGAELPEPVLASISAYYRRVTTEASPMGRVVAVVMAIAVLASLVRLIGDGAPRWLALTSLALCAGPALLAVLRVLPNAVRLARRSDSTRAQSALARSICRDHLLCLASIAVFTALELSV